MSTQTSQHLKKPGTIHYHGYKIATNSLRPFDTCILFKDHFTLRNAFETEYCLSVVLGGMHAGSTLVSSAHLPSDDDDKFMQAIEEIYENLSEARKKHRISVFYFGVDANIGFTADVGNIVGQKLHNHQTEAFSQKHARPPN